MSLKLLKFADETAMDPNADQPLKDGYYTMQRYGAIPAAALGAYGVYKGKGFKGKAVGGLAGVGAGFIGTLGTKTGLDLYKKYKAKKEAEEEQKIQELLSASQ